MLQYLEMFLHTLKVTNSSYVPSFCIIKSKLLQKYNKFLAVNSFINVVYDAIICKRR